MSSEDYYIKSAHEGFALAGKINRLCNDLIIARLEIEALKTQLDKYRPKTKKQGPDPRQRVFLFDLDRAFSWAILDREIEELELKEKGAAAQ